MTRRPRKALQAAALLIVAMFLVQPAQGAILDVVPGGPGDQSRHGAVLWQAMDAAQQSHLEPEASQRAVEAARQYEAAGFDLPPDLRAYVGILQDPMKRQAFGSLLQLYEQDPSLGQLKAVSDRIASTALRQAEGLDTGGIAEGPIQVLDRIVGKINFSRPETLLDQWKGLAPGERVIASALFTETARQYAATSNSSIARNLGHIADALGPLDAQAVADGAVDVPSAEEALNVSRQAFTDVLATIFSPEAFRTDPNLKGIDEATFKQMLLRHEADLGIPADALPPTPAARESAHHAGKNPLGAPTPPPGPGPWPYIVGFFSNVPGAVKPDASYLGGRVTFVNPVLRFALVQVSDLAPFEAAARLDPDVEFYEWDNPQWARLTMVPNDPLFAHQWAPSKVGAPAAWDRTVGTTSVKIAIIDTGLAAGHEEFAGSGRVLPGWNWVNNTPFTDDDQGHGSHVAGIAAATVNNGRGIAGMAQASIIPLKALDASGNGSPSSLANAVQDAADRGAQISSNSWGGGAPNLLMDRAVQYAIDAGVVMVAAAGNAGPCGDCVGEPWHGSGDRVIVVGATDAGDGLASFSSTGPDVTIGAPGAQIYSVCPTGLPLCAANACGDPNVAGYGNCSGTSMATPLVSGALALLKTVNPGFGPGNLRDCLINTALPLGAVPNNQMGYGRIRVDRLLNCPTAPGALGATAGDGNVTLEWSPSAPNGAPPVSQYRVLRAYGAGELRELTTVPGTRFVDTSVVNDDGYTYAITALNSVTNSSIGNVVSAFPRAGQLPNGTNTTLYDPDLPTLGDAGTNQDGNETNPTPVTGSPPNGGGVTKSGVLEKKKGNGQPEDTEDVYDWLIGGEKPAIWTVYLSTPAAAPYLRLSVEHLDFAGREYPTSNEFQANGTAYETSSPRGFALGAAYTRVSLQLPQAQGGDRLRIHVRLADPGPPAPPLENVFYQFTLEKYENDEGTFTGVSKAYVYDPPTGTARPNAVMMVHGFVSNAKMWEAPSDPMTWVDIFKGPVALTGIYLIFVVAYVQSALIIIDALRILAFAPLILGAIVILILVAHFIDILFFVVHWGNFFVGVARTHNGRGSDGQSMVDTLRGQGYFAATWQYHQLDALGLPNLAGAGSVKDAAMDMRHAINVEQSALLNYLLRQDPVLYSGLHPEDIPVSLVGHSMGGMVSRRYADDMDGARVQVGAMTLPMVENEVDRIVQIATPNGGSSLGHHIWEVIKEKIKGKLKLECKAGEVIQDIFKEVAKEAIAISVSIFRQVIIVITPNLFFYSFIENITISISVSVDMVIDIIIEKLLICAAKYVGGQIFDSIMAKIEEATFSELMTESTTAKWLDTHQNPNVPHAIIYGVPLNTWFDQTFSGKGKDDWKLFDIIVSEKDALPEGYDAGHRTNYDLHTTMVSDSNVKQQVLGYLEPIAPRDLHFQDMPKAWGTDFLTVNDWVLWYWNVAHKKMSSLGGLLVKIKGPGLNLDFLLSLIKKLGIVDLHDSSIEGLSLPPGVTTAMGVEDVMRSGNPGAVQDRLARVKGLSAGPFGFAAGVRNPLDLDGEALNEMVISDPSRDDAVFNIGARAPDVAVLKSGDHATAGQWLELAGEPTTLRTPEDLPTSVRTQRVLVVPQGGLEGLAGSASFHNLANAILERGGNVLVLDQRHGADWAAMPGGVRGYGSLEAASTREGSLALSAFGPEMAGQRSATPNMTADGFFTAWPANATLWLREQGSGNPVLLSYPWGNGTITLTTLAPLTEGLDRPITSDERALLRDLVNARRSAPAAQIEAAPGTVALDVPLTNRGTGSADHVQVTLLDPFLIVDRRFDVPLSLDAGASGNLQLVVDNVTYPGLWTVDVRLLAADNAVVAEAYNAARFTVSTLQGDGAGFGFRATPFSLTLLADRSAVLRGETANVTALATNRGDDPVEASVQAWLPEHFARTLDPAYGGGNGSGYALTHTLTIPANGSAQITFEVPPLTIQDAVAARLVVAGSAIAEGRLPLRAYDPTANVSVLPASAEVGPGEILTAAVTLQATSDQAEGRPGTARLTLLGADGLPVATADTPTTLGPQPVTVNISLAVPADVAAGRRVLRAEALLGGLVQGRAFGGVDVVGRRISVAWTLPPAFTAGQAALVSLDLTHRGTLPVAAGSVALTLLDPHGAQEWTGSQALALDPGQTQTAVFAVTPATAAEGTHRLVARVTTEDGPREVSQAVESKLVQRMLLYPGALVAGRNSTLALRAENPGRFVKDGVFELNAPSLGISLSQPIHVAPGASQDVIFGLVVPPGAAAGTHAVQVGLPGAPVNLTLRLAPARLALGTPATGPVPAGGTIALVLGNDGGAPAAASLVATLADGQGRIVATARLPPTVLAPLSTLSVQVAVPADAASGPYRLTAVTGPADLAGAGTLRRAYDIQGAQASLTVQQTAPVVDVGATATTQSTVAVESGALSAARIALRVLDPQPLPAVDVLLPGSDVTAVAAGDSLWAVVGGRSLAQGTTGGDLRRIAFPPALEPARIDALAAQGAQVALVSDRGLLFYDGAAWSKLQDPPPLARHVAFGDAGQLWIGTDLGLFRLTAGAWQAAGLGEGLGTTALSFSDGTAWAGMADFRPRLVPARDAATRTGPGVAEAAVVQDAPGRLHVFYADGPELHLRIQHVLLAPTGQVLEGPRDVSDADSSSAGGVAAARLADGRIAVAWHDARQGGLDVYNRLLDANARPEAAEVTLTTDPSPQRYPHIAVGGDGNVSVFWTDGRNPRPANSNLYPDDLYMQRVAPDGSRLSPEARLTYGDAAPGKPFVWQPRTLVLPDGKIHLVYTSIEIRNRCVLFFCFPRAVFEVWHQLLAANGAVLRGAQELSPDENGFSWFPDIALDPASGAVEVVYQDDRSGPTLLFHRRLDAATGNPLTPELPLPAAVPGSNRPKLVPTLTRLALAWAQPGGIATATLDANGTRDVLIGDDNGAFLPRVAALAGSDDVALLYEKSGALRATRTTHQPQGRGLAAIDAGLAVARFADDALVTGVAARPDGAIAATQDRVLAVDLLARSTSTIEAPGAVRVAAQGPVLAAYAAGDGVTAALQANLARPLGSTPVLPRAMAVWASDFWVATSGGLAKVRSDTRNVLASLDVPVAGPGPVEGSHAAPGPMGRRVVEAELINAAGQVLARNTTSYHAIEGDVFLTLTPGKVSAKSGDAVPVTLVATNRGNVPQHTVNVSLLAEGAVLAAQTVDLLPGASVSVVAQAAGAPLRLEGRARQPALGGLDLRVRDYVALEGSVSGRVLGPALAGPAPFDLDLVLANDADRGRAVDVTFQGATSRIVLPPGASRVLTYTGISQATNTTYAFTWTGDATGQAQRTVLQTPPLRATIAGQDVLAPGPGAVRLAVENPGLLPVAGVLRVARDSTILLERDLALGPGDRVEEPVTFDITEGSNVLLVTAPGLAENLTVTGSTAPVFSFALELPAEARPGDILAANVTLRGPAPFAGEVAWDLGFALRSSPLALAPGETARTAVQPDLTDVDSGRYPGVLRVEANGELAAAQAFTLLRAGPPINLTLAADNATVDAGTPLALAMTVQNTGFAPANVPLRLQLAGLGEAATLRRLDAGETAAVTLRIPIPADEPDRTLEAVLTAGNVQRTIPVTVQGHHATLTGGVSRNVVAEGDSVRATAQVHQAGAPRTLDLVVSASLYEARVQVPAQADFTFGVDLPVWTDDGIRFTLLHPGGRVLDTRHAAVSLDRRDTVGITGLVEPDNVAAGETVTLTLRTSQPGNVTVSFVGYEATFDLNGSRALVVPVRGDLRTGDYPVSWTFQNATDSVTDLRRVHVRGLEASADTPAVAASTPGEPLRGTLTVQTPSAVDAVLFTTLSGPDGTIVATARQPVHLDPGQARLPFAVDVPAGAAGPATLGYALSIRTATEGEVSLFDGKTKVDLPGTWFEDVQAFASPGLIGARGTLATTTVGALLHEESFVGAADASFTGPGRHAFEITLPVPENGFYPLLLRATDADGRALTRTLGAGSADHGTPPNLVLRPVGPNALLDDGTLVLGGATMLAIDASDEGSGVEAVDALVDGQLVPPGTLRLAPGPHVVQVSARDRAQNSVELPAARVIVDAQAPTLTILAPARGSLILDDHVVEPVLETGDGGRYAVGIVLDGVRLVDQGASPDQDGDGVPDAAEVLLGTNPVDASSVPSVPPLPIPPEVIPQLPPVPAPPGPPAVRVGATGTAAETHALAADRDGDGWIGAVEAAWGSSDANARDAPWTPRPQAPPIFDRPVLVVSSGMPVRFHAEDAVFSHVDLRVFLDGLLQAAAEDAFNTTLDLRGAALGEHLLSIVAADAVGNAVRRDFTLLVLPAAPDGLAATLAQDPRAPSWPLQFLHFEEEDAARLAAEAEAAAGSQQLRLQLLGVALQNLAASRTPPALALLPGHLDQQAAELQDEIQQCPCTRPPPDLLPAPSVPDLPEVAP